MKQKIFLQGVAALLALQLYAVYRNSFVIFAWWKPSSFVIVLQNLGSLNCLRSSNYLDNFWVILMWVFFWNRPAPTLYFDPQIFYLDDQACVLDFHQVLLPLAYAVFFLFALFTAVFVGDSVDVKIFV